MELHDGRSVSYLSKSLHYLKRTRCMTFTDGGWLCVTNWAGGEYYIYIYYIIYHILSKLSSGGFRENQEDMI